MSDVTDRDAVAVSACQQFAGSFDGQSLSVLDLYWLPSAKSWPESIKRLPRTCRNRAPETARSGLWVAHRRFRYARSYGGQDPAR
jgi:hypothetical protein